VLQQGRIVNLTASCVVCLMPPRTIDDPKHWHDRAEELRVLAEEMRSDEAKRTMLRLADDYDKLRDRAETRANQKPAHPKAASVDTGPFPDLGQDLNFGDQPAQRAQRETKAR
jgi:hypothetical protein